MNEAIARGEEPVQFFGTQGSVDENGSWHPLRIIDPETVNERRLSYGLDTLEAYVQRINEIIK